MVVLALPNLVPMVANRFSPIPSEAKMEQERGAVWNDIQPKLQEWREELGAGSLTTFAQVDSAVNVRRDSEVEKRMKGIEDFYKGIVRHQLYVNQQVTRISPSASLVFSATHLAGTGVDDYMALVGQTEEYVALATKVGREASEKAQKVEQQRWKDIQEGKRSSDEKVIDRLDPSIWPVFQPRPIALSRTMNDCWIDFGLLGGMTVLFFLLAFVGFMRYDVK